MAPHRPLSDHFPWTKAPLITLPPMRLIATAPLTCAVTRAAGLGFLGAGTDLTTLPSMLTESQTLLSSSPPPGLKQDYPYLPIGVGVITHKASLDELIRAITPSSSNGVKKPPCAIWLFAPNIPSELTPWADAIRRIEPAPQIWIQAGNVAESLESVRASCADVVVCQGMDAGGHGLQHGSSIVPLIPETIDALTTAYNRDEIPFVPEIVAAGGIMDGRGVAAAMALGAHGVTLGTRFLTTPEANVARGYKDEIVRAGDGGKTTVRSRVYDQLRGTDHWPARFGGRGVVNASYADFERCGAQAMEKNRERYREAEKMGDSGWGPEGRMTTYAGTGVGLVRQIMPAEEVVKSVRAEAAAAMRVASARL